MKCNTCQNEDYCYDGNHEITRYGCTDNGFATYVPQTNADRIRAMTDEELAEWMETNVTCCSCPVDLDACHNFEISGELSCEEILLDWLKAPVEEVQE